MKLEDVMSKSFQTIKDTATVFDAVKLMLDTKTYGLVVVDEQNQPVGLLSERSLIKRFILRNRRPDEVNVRAVMRRPMPAVPLNYSLPKVAQYLVENGLERTTVTDNGRVVGYITLTDLARYLSRERIWNILLSHRETDFVYFCPKCGKGTLRPVYSSKGEIVVYECSNPSCDYTE
ncbi:MAG: CBS domain-containing protein [Methanomassiliicoccales archaeon]